MARSKNTAPHAAHSATDTATGPAPATVAPAAGGSPAAAVLAALSANPAARPSRSSLPTPGSAWPPPGRP